MGICFGKDDYKEYYCVICDNKIFGELKLFIYKGKIYTICCDDCKKDIYTKLRKYNR